MLGFIYESLKVAAIPPAAAAAPPSVDVACCCVKYPSLSLIVLAADKAAVAEAKDAPPVYAANPTPTTLRAILPAF